MYPLNDTPNDENYDKIKVFSSDDDKLKLLGELLSNQVSRDIIRLLIEKEMYVNEIANKLGTQFSLISHHLKKMEELGLLSINKKKIIKKGQMHKYYKMSPGIFLLPNHAKDNVHDTGILKKIFRDGIKFASIAIVSFIIWTQTKVTKNSIDGEWSLDVNMIDLAFYEDETFFPMLAIILFLLGNIVYIRLRKKRFGH